MVRMAMQQRASSQKVNPPSFSKQKLVNGRCDYLKSKTSLLLIDVFGVCIIASAPLLFQDFRKTSSAERGRDWFADRCCIA